MCLLPGLQVSVVTVRVGIVVAHITMRPGLHHGCRRCVLPIHHVAHPRGVGAGVSAGACKIWPCVG